MPPSIPIVPIPNFMEDTYLELIYAVSVSVGEGIFVLGIIIYLISAAYRRRQGLDTSQAFKQIPPE